MQLSAQTKREHLLDDLPSYHTEEKGETLLAQIQKKIKEKETNPKQLFQNIGSCS